MVQGSDKPWKVSDFIKKLSNHLKEALQEARHQMTSETECQKCYYDKATSLVVLVLGDMVLLKSDACVGKRKINDWWEDKPYTVVQHIAPGALVYEIKDDSGKTQIIQCNRLLFIASEQGNVILCPARGDETLDQTQSVLAKSIPEGVMKELKKACTCEEGQTQASAQIDPLGWKMGKLWLLCRVLLGAPENGWQGIS